MQENREPDPIDIDLGLRISALRKLKGYSQSWLANKIGVTTQQMAKYESAKNRISFSRLMKIADAFKLPLSHFYDEPDHKEQDNFGGMLYFNVIEK